MIIVKKPTFRLSPRGFRYENSWMGIVYQELWCESLEQTFYYMNGRYYQLERKNK